MTILRQMFFYYLHHHHHQVSHTPKNNRDLHDPRRGTLVLVFILTISFLHKRKGFRVDFTCLCLLSKSRYCRQQYDTNMLSIPLAVTGPWYCFQTCHRAEGLHISMSCCVCSLFSGIICGWFWHLLTSYTKNVEEFPKYAQLNELSISGSAPKQEGEEYSTFSPPLVDE